MRFEKLLMCFFLDKNVSQFIGTPGAFVKQFHYLFYVILRYEWEQNDVIKRNILSKWDAWNVNFKKKIFPWPFNKFTQSSLFTKVYCWQYGCILRYMYKLDDKKWMSSKAMKNRLIKSGCHQKLWKIDYRYIHYIFSVHNLLL